VLRKPLQLALSEEPEPVDQVRPEGHRFSRNLSENLATKNKSYWTLVNKHFIKACVIQLFFFAAVRHQFGNYGCTTYNPKHIFLSETIGYVEKSFFDVWWYMMATVAHFVEWRAGLTFELCYR
jgi:hypothetical protein